MVGINKDFRTVNDGIEVVADDASEIQPAIDEVSRYVEDGGISSGTVRLKPKAYYPETTIWLKRGVTLKGSRPVHKHKTGTSHSSSHQGTTIYTSGMEKGSEQYTWHHFNGKGDREDFDDNHGSWTQSDYEAKTHPHLPVVAGFDRPPAERHRERTDEEWYYRGHGVGLEGLTIEADDKRWWDWEEHGESDHWTRPEHATYFGVFDGFIFEGLNDLNIQNVEISGFHGYGAFYADTRHIVSRGNFYNGGATDHHGSSLSLSFAALGSQARYVRGVWDVHVKGPTPTVELEGHGVRTQLVSGAWSRAKIDGRQPQFIGDPEDFENDDHLIGPPSTYKNTTIFQPDSHTLIDGYIVDGNGNDGSVAIDASDSNMRIVNSRIRNADVGIGDVGGSKVVGHNLQIETSDTGIECSNWQGSWSNCVIRQADTGIYFNGGAAPEAGFSQINFRDNVGTAIGGGNSDPVTFVSPFFDQHGIERTLPDDTGDFEGTLQLVSPQGYRNSAVGTVTFDADGSSTYAFEHGMDEEPEHVTVTARNDAGRSNGPISWSGSANEVTLTFESTPSSDPELSWAAYGWSHPQCNHQRSW